MPVSVTDIWHQVLFFKKTQILHAHVYFFRSLATLETHGFHEQFSCSFWPSELDTLQLQYQEDAEAECHVATKS